MVMPDSAGSVIGAFTEEQVERLTGVTVHQLRGWDRTGFFAPQFADENRRNPFSRIYSFTDVVSLQILGHLHNDLGVSLQHLRKVKTKLQLLEEDQWARTKLYVIKREVVFHDSEIGEFRGVLSGQVTFSPIILGDVRAQLEEAVRQLRSRDASKIGTIERHRRVMSNAWVIGGTRIPVDTVKSFHKAGYSSEQIIREYPDLTKEDIEAAIEHRGDRAA
jgi:uncharacterized protein (DUF433 family)